MDLSGTFTLDNHRFDCYLPSHDQDEQVWTIVVTQDGKEIRRETIPLIYRPIWGPDVGDVAARDERIEEIIKELGLKDADD